MLAFLIIFLIATLSGLGVGGGGLYTLYLTLCQNVPQLQAQGVNLVFFIVSAAASLLFHLQKRKFNFPLIALIAAVGIPGALFGSFLASKMDTALLSKIFGAFLTACGIGALFSRK
ncbi:MAG: sulfite exporter TauE/SafE family protein [Ruminococcaceae bacterium]|nr:sulfite exporter TauE/SafE family protein [Oscillospiraceae bacterium]